MFFFIFHWVPSGVVSKQGSGADTPFMGLDMLCSAANKKESLVHLPLGLIGIFPNKFKTPITYFRSASEIVNQKREFLRNNFKVEKLLGISMVCSGDFTWLRLTKSVLKQDNTLLKDQASLSIPWWKMNDVVQPPEVSIYVSGFPCTPFSTLGTLGRLDDPNARQMVACVKRIKVTRPRAPRSNTFVKTFELFVILKSLSCPSYLNDIRLSSTKHWMVSDS